METLYFFIDESKSIDTNIASLTCLIIDHSRIFEIRRRIFAVYKKIMQKAGIDLSKNLSMPPELHGNKFLQSSKCNDGMPYDNFDDDFRIEIINELIKIINEYNLQIYRLGYSHVSKMINDFNLDSNLYSELYLSLTSLMNKYAKDNYIIPVMDYIEDTKVKLTSPYVWHCMVYTNLYDEVFDDDLICSSNAKNFIMNTVYANSSENEFIQLVDIISYLLLKHDCKQQRKNLSNYSDRLVLAYNSIKSELIYDHVHTINKYKTNGY